MRNDYFRLQQIATIVNNRQQSLEILGKTVKKTTINSNCQRLPPIVSTRFHSFDTVKIVLGTRHAGYGYGYLKIGNRVTEAVRLVEKVVTA
jgi:hypothetical protein